MLRARPPRCRETSTARLCPRAALSRRRKKGFLRAGVAGNLWSLAAAAALAACVSVDGRQDAPAIDIPDAYSRSGGEPLPDRWWQHLQDPALSRLIERALAGSPSLAQSWDRLRQAEAVARRERADERPALDGSASIRQTVDDAGAHGEEYSLGLVASYEVDIWGRVRAASDAARFDVRASEAELAAAAITLSAEVARAWYELVAERAVLDLLESQVETNERVQELTELRFRQGQAVLADVLRQRQLVEQRRGEIADVRADIAVLEHELAVLSGRAPGDLRLPARAELSGPRPLPDTGLPMDLLRRRPDIRAAFDAIRAADARVAAAIADRYPRIDVSASFTSAVDSPGDLFSTWLATLLGDLAAPAFDAGARAAEVARAEGVVSERINAYEQQVLEALREVEDALAREARQHDKVASLERELALADQTVDRLTDRYTRGNSDFLDVLNQLISQQDTARELVVARRDLLRFRIDLVRALAGGWDMPAPGLRVNGGST